MARSGVDMVFPSDKKRGNLLLNNHEIRDELHQSRWIFGESNLIGLKGRQPQCPLTEKGLRGGTCRPTSPLKIKASKVNISTSKSEYFIDALKSIKQFPGVPRVLGIENSIASLARCAFFV